MRILAYHLILTCYGFWLPNDPRGSWSTFVRSIELYRAGGPATKVDTTRSVAHVPHDSQLRRDVKQALRFPPVRLSGVQAREVARGFSDYVTSTGRIVYAMCVMPDHVHLVLGRSDMPIETMAEQLKGRATVFLNRAGVHPMRDLAPAGSGRLPPPWARGSWRVYLNTNPAVRRAIRYVEDNPINAGLKPQRYGWTTPWNA